MHLTRNQAYSQGYREFESPPLRHRVFIFNNLQENYSASRSSRANSRFRRPKGNGRAISAMRNTRFSTQFLRSPFRQFTYRFSRKSRMYVRPYAASSCWENFSFEDPAKVSLNSRANMR